VWRLLYFGALVPNTYHAKLGGAEWSGPLLARGWEHLVFAAQQSGLFLPAVAVVGIVLRPRPEWLLVAGVSAVAGAIMVVVGGDFQFFFGPRMLMPATALLCLPAAAAILALADRTPPRMRRVAVAAGVSVLCAMSIGWSWPARDVNRPYVNAINHGWTELGRWLEFHAAPQEVVAVGAAGRIPYYSRRTTIDMLGLTDAHIARRHLPLGQGMPGHEKFDTPYVLGRAPDWVVFVLVQPDGQPAIADWADVADRFLDAYRLVAVVKARDVPGPWVLEIDAWTPALAEQGYQGAVYRRREL
jgi:hypothetical protein